MNNKHNKNKMWKYLTLNFSHLLYAILCVLTHITWKLQVVDGCSTYQTTVLLLEMSIFLVTAACVVWLVDYGTKHALQSLSDTPFLHTYKHNVKLQVVYVCSTYWTTALLLETFLVWFRVAWVIWLESYGPRCTLRSFFDTTCAYYKPVLTSLFGTTTRQQNSCSLWVYYTPNDNFTANNALFYKSKVIHHDVQAAAVHSIYLHNAVSFQVQWAL